jgi:predicted NAD/FAD-binding protein
MHSASPGQDGIAAHLLAAHVHLRAPRPTSPHRARHLIVVTDDPRFDRSVYATARFDALLAGAEPTPRELRRLLALCADLTHVDRDDCVRPGWDAPKDVPLG